MVTVTPLGQVAVIAARSMTKSSVVNPPGIGRVQRDRFDRRGVTLLGEELELAGPVGGVGEHLDRFGLDQGANPGGLSVADGPAVRQSCGDQPGVGLHPDMRLEPVAIVRGGLVACRDSALHRYHPIRSVTGAICHVPSLLPASNVLTGDERAGRPLLSEHHRDRHGSSAAKIAVGVVDQPR